MKPLEDSRSTVTRTGMGHWGVWHEPGTQHGKRKISNRNHTFRTEGTWHWDLPLLGPPAHSFIYLSI